jgi:short-subunit dehydrogenase
MSRLAVITGASSGIGAAFAERLAQERYDLLLVARRVNLLQSLAQKLSHVYSVSVEVFPVDLVEANQLKGLAERIDGLHDLVMLVNSAGFGCCLPFVDMEPYIAEELIRLHILALTCLTRAALPGMIQRARGAIINVSSRLAFGASTESEFVKNRLVYSSCKAYVNSFTQILASELAGSGVSVQALCPSAVKTEFHNYPGSASNIGPHGIATTPEAVVEASLIGLALGEVICVPSLENKDLLTQSELIRRQIFESSCVVG